VKLAAWTTHAEIRAEMAVRSGEVVKAQALCASEPLAADKSFEIGATPVLVELAKHNSTDFSADISIK
jgi:hypothetical protein